MVEFVILGAAVGILFAYMATRSKRNFRKKLLEELQFHLSKGEAEDYVSWVVREKAQWLRSLSVIRKPFRKEVNLTVETVALLLSLVGINNSFVNFDTYYRSTLEGGAVLCFMSIVVAYIPSEWFFMAGIEPQVDAVFRELNEAKESGRLDDYIAFAKKNWK